MGRRHRARATAFALVFVFAASGCGGNDTAPTSTSVDLAKLDSGNYPTTPLDVGKTGTEGSGAAREGIKIGAAAPLVMDIDNRFIFDVHKYPTRFLTPQDPPSFSGTTFKSEEFSTIAPGFVAGWFTYGLRREDMSIGRYMEIDTLRFSNASQASAAAQAMADRTPGENFHIPDYPTARTTFISKVEYGSPSLTSWLAHDDLVYFVRVADPVSIPFNPVEQADLVKQAFDKQNEMLKNYTRTPIDQINNIPLDVDGLLSRALPFDKDNKPGGTDPSAVYPKHAALHVQNRPNLAMAAFDDAGVDNIAASASSIYRTRDAASTTRLIAAMEAMEIDEENYAKIDSPPNLPAAHCFNAKPGISSASDYPPRCWIAFDRYVAMVRGRNVQDLHQRTAAQYKLLASGR